VSSLDPEGRRDVLELVSELRGEMTVVFSTHVLSDVERICDRVAILDRGRLVIESGLETLLAEHARPVFRLVVDPGQEEAVGGMLEALRAAPWSTDVSQEPGGVIRVGVTDADAAGRELLPMVVRAGVRLASFERARPSLEDVFLELVGPRRPDDLDGRGFVRAREVGD
jgi:ABC-2 type transport system ATP-binding protein